MVHYTDTAKQMLRVSPFVLNISLRSENISDVYVKMII